MSHHKEEEYGRPDAEEVTGTMPKRWKEDTNMSGQNGNSLAQRC